MNKANRPGINITRPIALTKEQMVRQMREAAANTAKVKAPKPKRSSRRARNG